MAKKFITVEEMLLRARERVERLRQQAKRELVRGAERIMTISKKEYVPVRDGILRNTGTVTPDPDPKRLAVTLSYGGPAVSYAIIQHENVFNHRVGEDHYLSKPLYLHVGELISTIAYRVKL